MLAGTLPGVQIPISKTVGAQGFSGGAALKPLVVKHLGVTAFEETVAAMQAFTAARDAATPDEIWLTEHWPVYTLGLAGKREHILVGEHLLVSEPIEAGARMTAVEPAGGQLRVDGHRASGVAARHFQAIPIVQTDRGGQVTYHAPGQLIAYLLVDLKRRGLKVRGMVRLIEDAVIATLARFGVRGVRRNGMPGVYVGGAGDKIAALGLKVKNGCTYHGVSLNVDLDLAPFAGINPCGYQGLQVTSLARLNSGATMLDAGEILSANLRHAIEKAV